MICRKQKDCLENLRQEIQTCTRCELCNLECNKKELSKGFGKLYGWKGSDNSDCRFLFLGMNPSHVRFPEHEFAFGGREGSPGPGQKFNILLRESKLLDKIYVDNLIHCSSVDNNIKSSWAQACFVYLVETIRVLKPIKIITMGRQVFEILNSLLAENNIRIDMSNIWHPSYVFSYRRSTPEEYKNMILNTCKEKL